MIEETIAGLSHPVILHGQKYENDLQISGKEVYFGTGGATPAILDHKTNQFRETTLTDLFDNARLIDKLENVDFFSRTVIARDIKISKGFRSKYDVCIPARYHKTCYDKRIKRKLR